MRSSDYAEDFADTQSAQYSYTMSFAIGKEKSLRSNEYVVYCASGVALFTYHAIAVGGNSSGENGVAQFVKSSVKITVGRSLEQKYIEICHFCQNAWRPPAARESK